VTITVVREQKEYEAELVRETIEVETVGYSMLKDDIGLIQITEFTKSTVPQFEKALKKLQKQGAKGLIFDIRDNPGGSLDSVCGILDLILPEGPIVYTEDKQGERKVLNSDEKRQLKLPIVVLVNGNSASASEIFAGAIKDYEMGTIVGTTTFGKGVVQNIYPLGDGTSVKLTASEYFSPKGNRIHGVGVKPDVKVEYKNLDNQLEKAYEIIRDGL